MKNNDFLNYFGEKEKDKLKKFADARTSFFSPILVVLTKLGCTSDMVSFASIMLMGGFIYFLPINVYYALLFVAAHILLDGIDGSLARYQEKASNKGAMTDIGVDHAGIIIAVMATIYYGVLSGFWASLYILSYTVLVTLVIVLNSMKKPAKFVFRSKYFFYLLLGVDAYFQTNYLEPFVLVVAVYMSLHAIYLFNRLRCSV